MLTLEEAIKHCEEKAEELERSAKIYQRPNRGVKGSGKRYLSCIGCASEHRQLAEWLRELKSYKESRVGCEYCKHNYREQHERPCSLCQRNFMDMFERKDAENMYDIGYNCGYADAMNDIAESEDEYGR